MKGKTKQDTCCQVSCFDAVQRKSGQHPRSNDHQADLNFLTGHGAVGAQLGHPGIFESATPLTIPSLPSRSQHSRWGAGASIAASVCKPDGESLDTFFPLVWTARSPP